MRYLFLLLFFVSLSVNAQDTLTYRDGVKEAVKVILVSDSEVRYKLYNHQHGPTYKANLYGLYSIKYENGEIQKYDNVIKVVHNEIRKKTEEEFESVYTRQIDLYIQNGWGVGFTQRKEINPYVGWNILGASYMSSWNNPKEFGIVNVRGLGFRFYLPSLNSIKAYAEMNIGYTYIYANNYKVYIKNGWGNTYNLTLNSDAHCFAFDFSAGFHLSEHLSIGYNLTFITNNKGNGIIHWGKLSILF